MTCPAYLARRNGETRTFVCAAQCADSQRPWRERAKILTAARPAGSLALPLVSPCLSLRSAAPVGVMHKQGLRAKLHPAGLYVSI